ncbi:uncharacterized protein LOC111263637 isoform X2 [Varroa jacobsoni]|uniref:Uncharacterized protein n=1 Tax=Varroa destructor TaxID=109461 RepID=A0A7M7J6P8_VARDE|nr:uncharacterized protein LOC111244594 isoform X2 [Varroa destructor]XP_022694662.1 uncharacterized protein LOC111263637 isoform X2 [Varroa jacobsoni]
MGHGVRQRPKEQRGRSKKKTIKSAGGTSPSSSNPTKPGHATGIQLTEMPSKGNTKTKANLSHRRKKKVNAGSKRDQGVFADTKIDLKPEPKLTKPTIEEKKEKTTSENESSVSGPW